MSDCDDSDARSSTPAPTAGERWREDHAPARTRKTKPGVSLDLARLADALPRLGAVLWLERREWSDCAPRTMIAAQGLLLLDHPALAVVARCKAVAAHTAVTPQGPREWLCFRDAGGNAQGKLYLLPDTDYLAWDEMTANSYLAPPSMPPQRWHAHAAFLRSALARLGTVWRARLLTFDLKRSSSLRMLDARPPLRISLLGLEIARTIARAEGAEFVSPLHTA